MGCFSAHRPEGQGTVPAMQALGEHRRQLAGKVKFWRRWGSLRKESLELALEGKVALLFGAGAIAQGYARQLLAAGCRLAVVSRGESAHQLVEELAGQGEAAAWQADAADYEAVRDVYAKTLAAFQQLDIVINGSGGNHPLGTARDLQALIDMDPQAPRLLLDNNYTAKWYSLQHFLAYLLKARRRGSVVNITSMSGFTPLSRIIHYSAAFAAVENLTRSMAYVYGHYGLGRVNNVAVGFVIGEQNRSLLLDADGRPSARGQEVLEATAQHRFLTADDIAPHVLYLADEEQSQAINGATLRVDGGYGLIGLHCSGYSQ